MKKTRQYPHGLETLKTKTNGGKYYTLLLTSVQIKNQIKNGSSISFIQILKSHLHFIRQYGSVSSQCLDRA